MHAPINIKGIYVYYHGTTVIKNYVDGIRNQYCGMTTHLVYCSALHITDAKYLKHLFSF